MTRDSLADWLAIRSATPWGLLERTPRHTKGHDDHLTFITGAVAARSALRAEKLLAVLQAARGDARAGRALDVDLVRSWAGGAPLRTTDAFAKGERYGMAHMSAFATIFQDLSSGPPLVAAARLYLDMLYFHPFNDGNGRLACIALDFVLTRAHIGIRHMTSIATLPRYADDPNGPKALVDLLAAVTYTPIRSIA